MLTEGSVVQVMETVQTRPDPEAIQEFYAGKKGTVVMIDKDKDWPIHVRFKDGTKPMRVCRFADEELLQVPDQRRMDRRQFQRRG